MQRIPTALLLPEAHLQLLVEVAVVDAAIPADTDCASAHDTLCRAGVKAAHQQL